VLHTAAQARDLGPDPHAVWEKLDPLFRALHTELAAAPSSGVSRWSSLPADSVISGFVAFDGSRNRLESLGAHVGTQVGNLFTVRVTAEHFERLLGDARVRSFQFARPLARHLYTSGRVIGSPQIHAPQPGFAEGVQGQGVLVGVVDSGIDLGVADFKDESGVTRLVGLWDQSFPFHPPPGFDYGAEYTEDELRAGGIFHEDHIGHGTHVAGIAAGNGRGTGHGIPAAHHVGVAPRADLAVVKLDPYTLDVGLVDGVRYLFDLARARGQDAVVNLSLGNGEGPRDGTSRLERMLSALTGPGRILVVSAGNDADDRTHARITALPGESRFIIPTRTSSPGSGNDFVTFEGWGSPGLRVSLTLVTPGGATYGPVAFGDEARFDTPEGDLTIDNDSDPWPLPAITEPVGNPSPWFIVTIADRTDPTHAPAAGTWTLRLTPTQGDGAFDVWTDGIGFTSFFPWPTFADADPSRTLDVPGTCDSCITVGSFVTMVAWRDSTGRTTGYADQGIAAAEVGALSIFSSRGPRRDGLMRPDLAAPGQGIASTVRRSQIQQEWRIDEDGLHVVQEGTSMSAPQVTGAVALLLQLRPHLPPTRVRDVLRRIAREDAFTGPVPNPEWGAGKLDLRRLVDVVNQTFAGGKHELGLHHVENPARAPVRFRIQAGVAQDGARLEVYSVDGRRVVERQIGPLPLGITEVEWDPSARVPLPAGVYFARVRAGASEATDKVVWLR
jgi:subtilisin family serine protease